MQQKLAELKGETDNSAVAVGDFSVALIVINRTARQKISEGMEDVNRTSTQLDRIDM